jgi:transcriptional regulator with XRE-family HTH domain
MTAMTAMTTLSVTSAAPPALDLRAVRLERRLSPESVSAALGVHPTTVLRWERRERLPGPGHVRALAATYDVPVATVAAFFDAVRRPLGPKAGHPGRGLRRLRRTNKLGRLTAAQVAAAVGVPAHTVYNWEAGRSRIPDHHLGLLAGTFGLEQALLVRLLQRWAHEPDPLPVGAAPLGRLRRRAGLSQATLAARAGVGLTTLKSWERGVPPSLGGLRGLASALGVPAAELADRLGLPLPGALRPATWRPGDLSQVLRTLREWSRLTQEELAERSGCSASSVRSWECGRLCPGPQLRRRLETLFRLPPYALLAAYPARTGVSAGGGPEGR